MKPLLSAPLTVEDRRVWRQVERRMVGKYEGWSWVRAVYRGGEIRDAELMFLMSAVKARMLYTPGQIAHSLVRGWMSIEKDGITVTAALKIGTLEP